MLKLLSLLFLYVNSGHCRLPWNLELHEFTVSTLESGKPIQLPENYTEVQICELEGTLYSDAFSQLEGVTRLRICRSNFNEIQSGALCSAPALKSLELDFRKSKNIPVLKKEYFENCENIEELILKCDQDNSTCKIDNDALEGLKNLKNLYIRGYHLKHLSNNFLNISSSLTILQLALTNIHQIDKDAFHNFENLEQLEITHNSHLETIPQKLFENNRKLKKLMLSDNVIKNLTFDEFEGLNNLEELFLNANRITFFDADKIAKNLPNLKHLEIDLNPPSCKEKEAFVNSLKSKLKHPIKVWYIEPGDSCEQEN